MAFTALFDACVLYPQFLRDVLLSLARTDLFRAKWTGRIQEEWQKAVVRDKPDFASRLPSLQAQIDIAVPDAYVTGYEDLIEGLNLPDPDDRHVLAAAIVGRADVIVTGNLRHFPKNRLVGYGIEPQHPDEFISHVLTLSPPIALAALREMRERCKRRPYTPEAFVDSFSSRGLPAAAAILLENVGLI